MTQLKNAYCNIIMDLDEEESRLDISRELIENMLSVEIGAAKPTTMDRHIKIMVGLGYIKLASHATLTQPAKYDLVASKVKSVRANLEK